MKTMKTKTIVLLGCLAWLSRGEDVPPSAPVSAPQLEAPAQPGVLPMPPEDFIAKPVSNAPVEEVVGIVAIHSANASTMSVASLGGAGGPGPNVPGCTNALDVVLTNIQATIVRRMTTNWFAGSTRSGTARVMLMGVEVPIPIYAQAGRIEESTRANFQLDGAWTGCDLVNRPVAALFRTFAADGTNFVFFPDITSDPLP